MDPLLVRQPPPVRNGSTPIWELVEADYKTLYLSHRSKDAAVDNHVLQLMEERDMTARKEHGGPLQAHNGRDMEIDALQELLDAACYLRGRLEEVEWVIGKSIKGSLGPIYIQTLMLIKSLVEYRDAIGATSQSWE